MYSEETGLIVSLIGIIVLITYFVMAARLGRIMRAIETMNHLELLKPENRKTIQCEKCKDELLISIMEEKGTFKTCPNCKALFRI